MILSADLRAASFAPPTCAFLLVAFVRVAPCHAFPGTATSLRILSASTAGGVILN